MENITNNNFGKAFGPATVFTGYIIIAFVLFIIFYAILTPLGVLICIALILFSGLACFTSGGILLNSKTKEYKDYFSYFGYKFGSWKKFTNLPYLFVDFKVVSTSASSHRTGISAVTSRDKMYYFYLLDKNMKNKQLIQTGPYDEFKKEDVQKYIDLMGVELVHEPKNKPLRRRRRN